MVSDPLLRAFHRADLFATEAEREAVLAARARARRRQTLAFHALVVLALHTLLVGAGYFAGVTVEARTSERALATLRQAVPVMESALVACRVEDERLHELMGEHWPERVVEPVPTEGS